MLILCLEDGSNYKQWSLKYASQCGYHIANTINSYPDEGSSSDRSKHLDDDVANRLYQLDISRRQEAASHRRVDMAAGHVADTLGTRGHSN